MIQGTGVAGTRNLGRRRIMVLYRYGWMAWIWRPMLLLFLIGGGVSLPAGLGGSAGALGIAAALLVPALFFGLAVAVRIEQRPEGVLVVRTLIGWPRRLEASRLGTPRLRLRYQVAHGSVTAPALWVPVRGGLPVYVDLLGDIPDRQMLKRVLRIPPPWK